MCLLIQSWALPDHNFAGPYNLSNKHKILIILKKKNPFQNSFLISLLQNQKDYKKISKQDVFPVWSNLPGML